MNTTTQLARIATALALVVILLGAWTRLKDAGLGCPDWPTCYGHIVVPNESHELEQVAASYPGQTVVAEKAWPEMIHRYFAATLGLLITAIALLAGRARQQGHPVVLPIILFFLVCVQGAFGAWTVTMKLMPIVVTTHLLLGFTTFSLLAVLTLQLRGLMLPLAVPTWTKHLALAAGVVLFVQIALGGWTSSNYAAVSCLELPICQGNWAQEANFSEAFKIHVADRNYEFGVHDHATRMAIHVAHRIGAMIAAVALAILAFVLIRSGDALAKLWGTVLAIFLLLQIGLGINNILLHLPLLNAVAHNGVGALLMMTTLVINVLLRRREN